MKVVSPETAFFVIMKLISEYSYYFLFLNKLKK